MQMPHKLLLLLIVSALAAGCAVKTPSMSRDDLMNRVQEDRVNMYRNQEPLAAPLTLEEALARGLKYNLDHRVKLMEDALSLKQVELMTFDMLPRVVAAAGYSERDVHNASSSMNVYTWQQSLAPSTSSDLGRYTGDLTMTWNILDFGVSYFQAKQQAERAHIMKERRRKVVHTMFQQIRQAYWQALGAEQLEAQFAPLLKEVNAALKDVEKIEAEKLRPPMETLTYKKTLLEIIKQLETFRDELAQAKPRLAALINLPVGQSFSLVSPGMLAVPEVGSSLEDMEIQALAMRPELREVDYNKRVSAHEVKKTILRMLPGVEMTVGGHYDSNSFLVHQKWIEGSARLTWNLLNLISGPAQYKLAKGQEELVQTQRMALSMAILTQVHVAHQEFMSRKRQFELADQLLAIDARISEQTSKQAGTGAESRLNAIKAATGSLMADYRRYQNYAALQNAYGQITATLGADPLPDTIESDDLKTLTGEIKKRIYPAPAVVPAVQAGPAAVVSESAPVMQPVEAPAVKAAPAVEAAAPAVAEVAVMEVAMAEAAATVAAPTAAVPTEHPKVAALRQRAEAGDAAVQRRLGWLYASGGMGLAVNKAEAIAWYEKAAGNGDMEAQQALGWLYYAGDGVTADHRKAQNWYRKAADQGSGRAVAMLKKMEKNGI
ncbi:TolC family protein [Trichlorobacter ammonificans]|uniref:Transporter n=1 Tax=Trichlorobacter ammonificans TaxID=2916410 RepID=A0ABM9D3I8_9BACT|nr:TolC family protein [Trichlorobacter ammonificans]CAH2029842.1 exported protein of unknown function [Trichlorobacter ammonificans]